MIPSVVGAATSARWPVGRDRHTTRIPTQCIHSAPPDCIKLRLTAAGQVCANDKKPLIPDVLLSEARVALGQLSLSDSHVASSDGGHDVQVRTALSSSKRT